MLRRSRQNTAVEGRHATTGSHLGSEFNGADPSYPEAFTLKVLQRSCEMTGSEPVGFLPNLTKSFVDLTKNGGRLSTKEFAEACGKVRAWGRPGGHAGAQSPSSGREEGWGLLGRVLGPALICLAKCLAKAVHSRTALRANLVALPHAGRPYILQSIVSDAHCAVCLLNGCRWSWSLTTLALSFK